MRSKFKRLESSTVDLRGRRSPKAFSLSFASQLSSPTLCRTSLGRLLTAQQLAGSGVAKAFSSRWGSWWIANTFLRSCPVRCLRTLGHLRTK